LIEQFDLFNQNHSFGLLFVIGVKNHYHWITVPHRFLRAAVLPYRFIRNTTHFLWAMQGRERTRLWYEMNEMRGLLPLLMKRRNGERWSELDRKRIRVHLHKLMELSPYMVLFIAPGGFFVLPLLAWWLDRRHPKPVQEPVVAEVAKQIQP
jgi:hypothetical protein